MNAYSIVLLQNDSTIDRAAPEPHLEPNPVAMEEVVNDNKHNEDDRHHEMVNNSEHNKGKICDVSNWKKQYIQLYIQLYILGCIECLFNCSSTK